MRVRGRKASTLSELTSLYDDDLRGPSWVGLLLTADALGTAVQPCVPDPSRVSHDIHTPFSEKNGIQHARAAPPLCQSVQKP